MDALTAKLSEKLAEYSIQIIVGLFLMLVALTKYIGRRALKDLDEAHARLDHIDNALPSLATKQELDECQEKLRQEMRHERQEIIEHFDRGISSVHRRFDEHMERLAHNNMRRE